MESHLNAHKFAAKLTLYTVDTCTYYKNNTCTRITVHIMYVHVSHSLVDCSMCNIFSGKVEETTKIYQNRLQFVQEGEEEEGKEEVPPAPLTPSSMQETPPTNEGEGVPPLVEESAIEENKD